LPVEGLVNIGRNCAEARGDVGIEAFDLFLSAFGFFFSRLLLSCPFAILSSILHRHGGVVARPLSGSFVPVRRLSRDHLRLEIVLPQLQDLC
jgi:hypothetical protein